MDKQLTVYLTDETYENLRRAAYEDRLSMSEIIRRSVIKYLAKREGRLSQESVPEVRLSDEGVDGLL